jgi:hypothetical protein
MTRHACCIITAAALVVGCADTGTTPLAPDELVVPLVEGAGGGHHGQGNFRTHATGAEEVPSNDSRAQGQAIFRVTEDGLHFRLIVANIHDVTMAHIHVAPAGVNGPVVAWLYPSGPPPQQIPGRTQGVLAEGTITAAQLVGPLAGASLDDLIEHLRNGTASVNIHTTLYPAGEIRGQIR